MSNEVKTAFDLTHLTVSSDPKLTTITPKSGPNKDKQIAALEFTIVDNFKRDEKGKLVRDENNVVQKKDEAEFHTVKMYGDAAKQVGNLLKKGMAVNVEGSKTTETWPGKDGSEKSKSVINTTNVSLNLSQKRIKSVEFDQTPTKDAAKDADKGKGGKTAEAQAAQPPKPQPQKVAKKAADKVQSPDR